MKLLIGPSLRLTLDSCVTEMFMRMTSYETDPRSGLISSITTQVGDVQRMLGLIEASCGCEVCNNMIRNDVVIVDRAATNEVAGNNIPQVENVTAAVENIQPNRNGDVLPTLRPNHYRPDRYPLNDHDVAVAQCAMLNTMADPIRPITPVVPTVHHHVATGYTEPVGLPPRDANITPVELLERAGIQDTIREAAITGMVDIANDNAIVEDDDDPTGIINGISDEGISAVVPIGGIITKDQLPAILSRCLGGSSASNAKLYLDKIEEYNKLLSRMTLLLREISELKPKVTVDAAVTSIIDALQHFDTNEGALESYKLTDRFIILRTKELDTDIAIDGRKRKLGSFDILIDINGMIGTVASAASIRRPIRIFNRTRRYNDGDMSWMCGHVDSAGTPCFGNATPMIVEAMSKSDLYNVFDVVVRFIKNPDVNDSWGCKVKHFPAVD